MNQILRSLTSKSRTLKRDLSHLYDRITIPRGSIRPEVIVLGNQKSGTSAIAHLLADYGGLTKTIDIPVLWGQNAKDIYQDNVSLAQLVYKHPRAFTAQLLKEPNLTFMFDQLYELFSDAKYVFVIRNPYDNIRSILNRVKLSGDLDKLSDLQLEAVPASWRSALTGLNFGTSKMNYIESLAYRWNKAAEVCTNNKDKLLMVKYEDFTADKLNSVINLADRLGIKKVNDIRDQLDVQFQPKGMKEDPQKFFSRENLNIIQRICGEKATALGY